MPRRNSHSYVKQKLHDAVFSLIGSADFTTRVTNAATNLLIIDKDDFDDPELRAEFEELRRRVTAVDDPTRGRIPATCAEMSESDQHEVAKTIMHLFVSVLGGL